MLHFASANTEGCLHLVMHSTLASLEHSECCGQGRGDSMPSGDRGQALWPIESGRGPSPTPSYIALWKRGDFGMSENRDREEQN